MTGEQWLDGFDKDFTSEGYFNINYLDPANSLNDEGAKPSGKDHDEHFKDWFN